MAYDDIDFGSIIGDRANLYETADGKRFMATDAESPDAFNSLGLTRQKKVVFKGGDGYNHAVSVDDGFTPDDNWMREHDAKSIVKTETPDNYVYRVNTYALPDGQMTTVREDQDEEFRDWATKTYGAQPTLQTHARVNGVYVSGANDQINEVLRMAKEQETGLTAEQLAAIGVTEEQANAGIEAMLASKDTLEERVKKMGEIGFAEAESHDRGYRKLGHEIDDGWDATKATLATGLDIATGLLDIGTLGFADVVRTPEVMIQVYGNPETGLQSLKDRAWVNKQADLARMAVGDAEYDKLSDMSDEELHEYFKGLLLEQRKMEYLDSLRGRTTGANVGTTITGTAESGLDFWASTAAGSAAGAGLGAAVGTVAPGLGNAIGGVAGAAGGAVAGATGYLLSHAASERDVAKTSKMAFDPITGKLVEYAPGMSGGRAAVAGIVNPLVEWGVERVGGKIGGKLMKPVKGGLAKAIGRDRAILFGIMPGVASRPANTALEKLAEKTAAGFRRFAAGNTWGAKLANLTGNAASRMTPGAIGGELFEEYLQAAIEGGFNLRGELVDEYGELAGMDLGNAAAAFMDVFRTTPELALGIAIYGAGSGVAARGYGALVDGYATKATMKKWLEKWGYDKAAIRSMSSEEMKTHFMDAITKPGEDAGKRAEEFLKDKSGKVLERLARSAFATSTNGYDIVETTDENGKKSFALVRNTWMAKLKPGETHNEAESRTQPVVLKSNSREEVESKLRELLVENAKQNGLYTLTVNPAMDDVTRAAMHITRGRQSEIRRVVQEMGIDKAFAGWGNSADVYDLLSQAITLRMAATSTNVRNTDYARFLRFAANHLENMAAAQMGAEYGKRLGANVFLQYSRYARGASVVTHPTKGEAPQVFKNPDEEKNAAEGVKWSVDSDGTEYMQEGDVRLERSLGKDHKYTYRVRMTGKYSSAPYYYSEAGKAFARANAMHESVRSFEQEYEERKRRANQMYDELFGTDDDSRSGFTVVETVWEDPQAVAEIIEDLTAKGMTQEQAMAAMNKKTGVRLKSGRIVVFLNNNHSLAELAATIRHEAMHGGLEAHISEALGGDKAKALKFLKDVSAILREAGVPIKGLDGAALSEEDLDKLTDAEFRLAIDEALAALAETVSAKSGYSGRIFKIVNEAFHDKKSLDGLTSSEKLDEARNILFDAYMRVNARDIGEDMDMAHAEEVVRSFQEKVFNLNKWKTQTEPTGDETGPDAGMNNKPRPDVPPGPKKKWGDAYDVFYGPDSGTAETVQVPVSSISVNDRIKQFKRDADPETGIVEGDKLSGQWSDEFGQPIRLMRFKDGHLEVITGRHRLELAKRNGMDTIPARIYNETDGMTVDLAKAIDAIENIQAGKGSETDFITFFIKSHLDRRIIDALQLNTSENTQIKAAWDIATKGVNGLISYALIPREGRKVGILALGAIAEQPANIQMQLLAEAHNDTTGAYRDPVFIRQFGQRIANAEHYEDVELFGEDDPAIVQMKLEAIGIKTIIKRLEGDLQTINNAINSRLHNAIRPELVKRYGIKDQRDKKELRQVAAKIRKQIEAYESPSVSGALLEEARKVGKEELEKINKRNKARGVQDIMSFINDFSERPLGKNEDPNTRGYTQPEPTPEPEPTPTGGTGTGGPTPTGEPDKGTEAPPGTTGPQPTDGHSAEEPLPEGVDHVRDGDGYIQWATREHNAYKLRFKFGEGPGSRKETKGKTVKGVYVYDTNVDGSIRPETEEFYELLDKPYTSKGGKVHYGHMTNRNHQGEGMRSAFGNMWNVLDAWAVAGYPGATEAEKQGTHLVRLGLVQKPDTATDTTQEGDGFTLSGEPGTDTQSTGQQDGQQEPEDPFSQPPDYTGSGMAQDDLFGNTEGQEQQPAPEPAPTPEPEPAPETELPAPVNERGFDPATYDWSKGERNGRDVTKDDFKKTFGFNKVTIGKKGAQGQKIANAAYDAFVALAKAANIPYEAISLGGYIKSVVLGVYHADRNGAFDGSEIRINKDTDGFQSDDSIAFERASSIIHEWAHALDAALSRGRNFLNNGGNGAKRYMSNREETLPFTDGYTKPREILPDVRADMVKAYDKMLDALMDSGFWHRVYETQKTVNYPRRPAEMFARAIQAYITALHAPEAIRNVYLDHMKLTDTLSELAEGKKSSGARRSTYPYKDEVEELAPAFDAFFGALRVGTNEATGKMTLYRESEEAFPEAPRSTLKDRVEIRGAMAVPFAGSKASILEDYPELFRGIGNAAKEAGGRIIDAFAGAGAYTAGLGALDALPQGSVLNEWAVSRYVMHKMLAENPEAMARAAEDIATRFVNSPEMAEVRRRVEQANKDGKHVVNLTQPVIDWFYDELKGKHGTVYVDGTDNTEFGDASLRETPESAALYQVLQTIVSSGYPVNFVWKKGELKIDVSGGNFRAGQVGRVAEKNGKTNKWRMSKPGEGVFNVKRYPQRILNTGRIYQQNGVQVTRGDGWALAKTARRGDVILVDPAYLGTQSYGGKKNVDANDANNKDIAIDKLVDLVKWADANGVSVVYTNEFSDKSGMGGMSRADYEAVWREAIDKIGSDGVAVNFFNRKVHGMRGSQAPRADVVFATGRVAHLFNVSNAELASIKARHGFETDEEAMARAMDERTAVLDNITDSQESDDWRQTLYRESEDADYLDAVRRGDTEAARRMVEERARKMGVENPIPEQTDAYKVRVSAPPKKTIKVYKVFTIDQAGRPTALFVSGMDALPMGVWLDAQDTWHFTAKNGKQYIPSTANPNGRGGKTGTAVEIPDEATRQELIKRGFLPQGSKAKTVVALAYRPGWHAGDMPFFPQGGVKRAGSNYGNVHHARQVVFECEMDADHDYTDETRNQPKARTKDGRVNEANADLQSMPDGGFYRYSTNPLTKGGKRGTWFISGSLKINRALTQEEADRILQENGFAPQEWEQGKLDLAQLGYRGDESEAARKTLSPVTYDDNGNVIPLSQRFNPYNPNIRYRGATDDGAVEQVAAADAADFLRREARRMRNTLRGALSQGSRDRMAQWLEEAFINAQAPVFRLYRRIVDDLPPPRNAQEARLRDELNIEAAIKNEPGRIRWRREKLKRDYLDRINRILKQGKCDANLFSDYLYFHYVPERNAMLYARETTTDESGDVVLPFDPVTGEEIPFDQYKGSGYSNEEAKAGIERIEQMPNGQAYKDAAKLVWEMNQNTLRELVQAGIIAQRQGERWMRDAPHYVPLKDIDAMDRKSALFSLRVVGRKIGHVATANTWAASAYQALEAQSMIERNNTKAKFLRFLKTYDPDGKHIKWWHLTNPGNEKEAGMEDAVYVSKYDEEYQKLKAAGVNMVEAGDGQGFFVASGGPSDYSKGKLGVHIRNKTKQGSNAVLVMQNGRRTYITFDASVYAKQRKEGTYVQPGRIEKYQRIGDADWEGLRIAEAMNDANKRRFDIPILSWATRFKARISTSWNPNFIIGNIPIDIINTVTLMGIEGRWKEARQFLLNYKSAMKTVYQYQRDRSYTDKQMGKYLEEAMQGGMMTGTYGQSFAAVDEDFRNTISGLEGGAGRIRGSVQGLVDKLDKLSNVAEIGTRLAVYAAMRMNGMNKNEAAQYGREITVDFNANGNYTPVINTLYMFSNAAAQSFVRYVNAVKYGTKLRGGGAKGLAKTLLPVIALHMALGFLIAMLNDADEGEGPGGEDESTERRIPDYVWEGGVPISLPFFDGYLNVPMRGALVPFMKAGRDTYEMFKGRKEATEVMGNLISGTLESTVNIFGQSPNLEQWISPTALDPFVQIMTGKDWTGRELYRRDYGQAGSDAHLGLGRTPSLYHWMAKGMNAATGGNDVEGGLVDWRPETYKLLTDFFLGSLSGYALNSVDMVHGIGKGELPRPNDIPFVGRVLRETPGVSNRYYTALGESAELEKIYRKRVADSKSPELSAEKRRESAQQARDLREEHRWLKSVKAMGDLQRRITERRDRSKEMEDGPRKETFDKETERLMGTWLRVYERR